MKRILLLWYRKGNNFGDVLLSESVRTALTNEGYYVEDLEVGTAGREIFTLANNYDFLLFAGGGIIERGVPSVIKYYSENKSLLKIPYGVMGIGIGNFDYSNYLATFSEWVADSKFFFSRDDYTKRNLNNLVGDEKVVLSADCVFFNKRFKNDAILKRGDERVFGINLRTLPYIDITGDYDWNLLNTLLLKIGNIIKIPDCEDATYNLADGIIEQNADVSFTDSNQNQIDIVVEQIKKCKWIIATRYHVVLVAALFGIPSIPIIYCPKVGYLAEQLGISDLAIELGQYDLLEDKVHRLEKNYCSYLTVMNESVKLLKTKANDMFESVLESIKNTL